MSSLCKAETCEEVNIKFVTRTKYIRKCTIKGAQSNYTHLGFCGLSPLHCTPSISCRLCRGYTFLCAKVMWDQHFIASYNIETQTLKYKHNILVTCHFSEVGEGVNFLNKAELLTFLCFPKQNQTSTLNRSSSLPTRINIVFCCYMQLLLEMVKG